MNRDLILLRTLLLSTSQRNIYKYCNDKKKRGKIVGGLIGAGLIYAMIMAYCILMCIGYGAAGLIDSAPVMCALIISLLAFLFTFFKTNGYLFNFKEYDMLMSLPFEARTVAGCKFLYMYVKSLPWYLSISLAMLIGYGAFAQPAFYVYPVWIILAFFLPVILPSATSAHDLFHAKYTGIQFIFTDFFSDKFENTFDTGCCQHRACSKSGTFWNSTNRCR